MSEKLKEKSGHMIYPMWGKVRRCTIEDSCEGGGRDTIKRT